MHRCIASQQKQESRFCRFIADVHRLGKSWFILKLHMKANTVYMHSNVRLARTQAKSCSARLRGLIEYRSQTDCRLLLCLTVDPDGPQRELERSEETKRLEMHVIKNRGMIMRCDDSSQSKRVFPHGHGWEIWKVLKS